MLSRIAEFRMLDMSSDDSVQGRHRELQRELRVNGDDAGNCGWKKSPVRRLGQLLTLEGAHIVMVLEASADGFRIKCQQGLEHHCYIDLMIDGERGELYRFPCRVIWERAAEEEFGLQIDGRPTLLTAGVQHPLTRPALAVA